MPHDPTPTRTGPLQVSAEEAVLDEEARPSLSIVQDSATPTAYGPAYSTSMRRPSRAQRVAEVLARWRAAERRALLADDGDEQGDAGGPGVEVAAVREEYQTLMRDPGGS